MTLRALVQKEVYDLAREKRFGAWALAYTLVWAVVLTVIVIETRNSLAFGGGPRTENLGGPAEMMYFVTIIALGVLALFVATDGVCRERESGTLPLVAATPVERAHVLLAKLAASGAAYLASFIVVLLVGSVFAFAYGGPFLGVVVRLYAIPFLAFYVFLAGVGLLIGVLASSSKVALGAAVGIYFPLFFLNPYMNLDRMFADSPWVGTLASYTPFHAAQVAMSALIRGGYLPWGGLLATVGMGVACAVAAFVVFTRQEGAV